MYSVRKGFQTVEVSSFEQLLNMYKSGQIRDNDMVTDLVTKESKEARQILGVYADKGRSFNEPQRRPQSDSSRQQGSPARPRNQQQASNRQPPYGGAGGGSPRPMPMGSPGGPGGRAAATAASVGFFHSAPVIMASLIFCFPLGVLLLWTRPRVGILGNPLVKIVLPLLMVYSSYQMAMDSLPPDLRKEVQQLIDELLNEQLGIEKDKETPPSTPPVPGGIRFEWGTKVDKNTWKITEPKSNFVIGDKAVFLARDVSCKNGKLIEVLTWTQGAEAPVEQYERPFDWKTSWDIYTDAFTIEKTGTFTVTLYCGTRETPIGTASLEVGQPGEVPPSPTPGETKRFEWGTGVDTNTWNITGSKILFYIGDTAHYLVKGVSCNQSKVVEEVYYLGNGGRTKQFELASDWQGSYDVYTNSFKITQKGIYQVSLYCGEIKPSNELAKGNVVVAR